MKRAMTSPDSAQPLILVDQVSLDRGNGRVLDQVSLTVSAVGRDADGDWFEVAIIPHTWQVTTLGQLQAGDKVNLEVDMLARYVARMLEWRPK